MPKTGDTRQNVKPVQTSEHWQHLQKLAEGNKNITLGQLFSRDPKRSQAFRYQAAGINIDISRQHVTPEILTALLDLASSQQMSKKIQDLLNGCTVNATEQRAALHTALRGGANTTEMDDEVKTCLARMEEICRSLHQGQWLGFDHQPIRDIVNIGIGGSDLGPRMAAEALAPFKNTSARLHYVSNMDPANIHQTLRELNPATTLFIVASKSWRTPETLSNAALAKAWLLEKAGDSTDISMHFIAISTALDLCHQFGVASQNILPLWDWAGGRYSLWSAIGLSIALATSFDVFKELLSGAKEMDRHFADTAPERNIALIMALVDIWQVNFRGHHSLTILPYSHDLRLLPDHLQQLIMESNGKSVGRNGDLVSYPTCPVIWGAAGTNGQHSFHQLLHQGTESIPAEFILPLHSHTPHRQAHMELVANCLAQAEVMMDGQSCESITEALIEKGVDTDTAHQLARHKAIPGNRPSTIISLNKLTPRSLGALIAFYEHRVYCASVIWDINAFDQWGVELGKVVSKEINEQLSSHHPSVKNPATQAAIIEIQKTFRDNKL